MSCCGKKRRAWLEETSPISSTVNTPTPENEIERRPKIFEYIGQRSKRVIGTSSGNTYFFRFTGHRIIIPHEDTFGMMGEGELKVHHRK